MLRPSSSLFLGFLLLLILQASAISQSAPGTADASWIRVQGDDGDFSIEVPASYKFYANEKGFSVGYDRSDFPLRTMQMLNAHIERSTLSFEVYEASRGALNAIYEMDKYKKDDLETSSLKIGDVKARRLVQKSDKYFYTRQYFAIGKRIYILTAIARDKETPAVTRFLNSVQVASGKQELPGQGAVLLSKLKMTDVVIEQDPSYVPPKVWAKPKEDEPGVAPMVVFSKPRAAYTPDAREKNAQGSIFLNVTLSEDAYVPKIIVLGNGLHQGLLRNALFSAIRIKFLPKEKDNRPSSVIQKFEYTFSIY